MVNGTEILGICKKGDIINTLEEFEIYKAQIDEKKSKTNHV